MMITEKAPSEPSMDEILASIRQIISSDSKGEPQPYFPNAETEDVLDLTDAFPEDQDNTASTSSADIRFHDVNEWTSNANQKNWSHEEEPLHSFNASPGCSIDSSLAEDSLLSQATVSEATQAFHLLNKNVQEKSPSSKSEGQALENLMREMLKPLLKEWLDAHLPSLVRSIVTEQVEKIVQQAGDSHSKRVG